ncbi:MAG: peptidoglycan-binding protein [Gammaproteobacteria bacterium]|nr:peptidoglycan-binding protein [Gammaproteobacteria bacterium]
MRAFKDGDHGDGVAALQRALINCGYSLPRWGADGWYGGETDDALDAFAQDHGNRRPQQDEVSSALVDRVLAVSRALDGIVIPGRLIDTRDLHHGGKRLGVRQWKKITGITLHQTSTCYYQPGQGAAKLERAIRRVSDIGVHMVGMREGTLVLSNPLNARMPQAQEVFNHTDVGIEIDGWFAGVEGDMKTCRHITKYGRTPMAESREQTESVLDGIRYIRAAIEAHGGKLKHIHAHRQTSATRRADPGELLWKTIAIPAMEEHNLTDGGDDFFIPHKDHRRGILWSTRGPGRPIPSEWDPRRTSRY